MSKQVRFSLQGLEALRVLRPLLRTPVLLLALYAGLHWVFGRLSSEGGLVTPDGSVSLGIAFLGVWVLLLRLIAICILPPLCMYRIAKTLLQQAEVSAKPESKPAKA
jgi:hypothetical protein